MTVAAQDIYILVTGANSGLGLAICYRLIDDFLRSKSSSAHLTLIFTTRSTKKGSDTLKALLTHLAKHTTAATQPQRVFFHPENVELTDLLSVRALSRRLLDSDIPKIDAVILNAGIIGLAGLNWPLAIWTVLTDTVHTLTWPTFKIAIVGLLAKPQLPATASDEPPLGEVFCANIFGHYLLAHWLMPLLRACESDAPGKVIWTSSIEATARHFDRNDLQGLTSPTAYEHSKRLTDLMALTAKDQPATARDVRNFLDPTFQTSTAPNRPSNSTPCVHVIHPGVCVTAIVPLHWIMLQLFVLAVYLSRFLGSPWATVSAYTGALSATWVALASDEEMASKEANGGRGTAKWGSAVSRGGKTCVERTDVEGWGTNGSGVAFGDTWWATDVFGSWGRFRGSTDATKEAVERFVEDGARVWRELEELRVGWEARIEGYERYNETSSV